MKARDEQAPNDAQIDDAVTAQAEDDAAWERPVRVRRGQATSVKLPAELAVRAAFFARLHHASSVQRWVAQIVKERTDLEEAAFASLKRDLEARRRDEAPDRATSS